MLYVDVTHFFEHLFNSLFSFQKTLQIYHAASGMCMAATGKNSIKMAICDDHPLQQWQFTYD